jgi:Flp pilus assembly protein TadB
MLSTCGRPTVFITAPPTNPGSIVIAIVATLIFVVIVIVIIVIIVIIIVIIVIIVVVIVVIVVIAAGVTNARSRRTSDAGSRRCHDCCDRGRC